MIKTNRAQRLALKQVFDRQPLCAPNNHAVRCKHERPISYREFRKTVQGGWGCIMVKWCGMWLGIEPDGYTHS